MESLRLIFLNIDIIHYSMFDVGRSMFDVHQFLFSDQTGRSRPAAALVWNYVRSEPCWRRGL